MRKLEVLQRSTVRQRTGAMSASGQTARASALSGSERNQVGQPPGHIDWAPARDTL
jgi:hypothetical protein